MINNATSGSKAPVKKKWSEAHFLAYLRQIGHPQEAQWVSNEIDADQRAIAKTRKLQFVSGDDTGLNHLIVLTDYWRLGIIFIKVIIVLILLAILGSLLSKTQHIQQNKTIKSNSLWGIITGATALIIGSLSLLILSEMLHLEIIVVVILLLLTIIIGAIELLASLITIITWGIARLMKVRASPWFMKVHAPIIATVIGIAVSLFLIEWFMDNPFNGVQSWYHNILFSELDASLIGKLLDVPLLIFMFLFVAGYLIGASWKIPISVGLVKGLRNYAAVCAFLFVILYCGIVLKTVRQEAKFNASVSNMSRNECVKFFDDYKVHRLYYSTDDE